MHMKNHGFPGLVRKELHGCTGYMVSSCGSAMDLAWDLHGSGLFSEYAWVLAQSQTRGRGRMGRQWVSVFGNLFAAIRLPDAAGDLGGLLSLSLALPLVTTLAHLDVPARIKWPNDIMVGPCKVGGILVEEKQKKIVAGIGMNLCTAPQISGTENFFHITAGCLHQFGVHITPSGLWHLFLKNITYQFPKMMSDPAFIAKKVDAHLAWKDQAVVLENTGKHDGPAQILGVDPRGRLSIRTAKGISFISSGTIHPRMI
jgi:BirA family transcriptional regulator, biotin operon repressor / biotin---[acetyl-CoA-carboxylase] ligase